jgi:hypothetical protein
VSETRYSATQTAGDSAIPVEEQQSDPPCMRGVLAARMAMQKKKNGNFEEASGIEKFELKQQMFQVWSSCRFSVSRTTI